MADLLGFTTIALVSLITLLIGFKWPDVSKFIFAALILRILFMLAGHYIVTLPDSTQDAAGFEHGGGRGDAVSGVPRADGERQRYHDHTVRAHVLLLLHHENL
jgi:hypothetical protein